jgi:dynein heavy chain
LSSPQAFKESYLAFEYLWRTDLAASLADFLAAESGTGGAGPSLERFDAAIARFKGVQEQVQALPAVNTVGWIRVDAKPIKQALSTWVTKWVFLYTHYLSSKVVDSMDELYNFMQAADKTVSTAKPVLQAFLPSREFSEICDATEDEVCLMADSDCKELV